MDMIVINYILGSLSGPQNWTWNVTSTRFVLAIDVYLVGEISLSLSMCVCVCVYVYIYIYIHIYYFYIIYIIIYIFNFIYLFLIGG